MPVESLTSLLALSAALTPALLGFAAARGLRLGPVASRRLATAAAAWAALAAFACAIGLVVGGPVEWTVARMPVADVGIGVYLDPLTALVLPTVTLIGAVVARYSERYLAGDPGQAAFSQWLSLTLSGVLVSIVSSSLAVFLAGAVVTSIGLDRLLRHRADRPTAARAARQRRWLARVGDALLLAACLVAYGRFGSVDFGTILPAARGAAELGTADPSLVVLALLVAVWGCTQSAQFPFHTWLPNTMDAPTPVSALMHAGIVNAGGILLIRMSPVMVASPGALTLLVVFGVSTAVLGALVMLTQTEIKAKYAYSTVSQMGFMLLQCGLGAFGAAALHIVGHSFYKGHAFLSAASAVDPVAPAPVSASDAPVARRLAAWRTPVGAALGVVWVGAVAFAFGIDVAAKPGGFVLAFVLSLGLGQALLLASSSRAMTTDRRAGLAAARDLTLGALAVAGFYFGGVAVLRAFLGDAIPAVAQVPALPPSTALFVVFAFAAAMVLQDRVTSGRGLAARAPWLQALYVHLRNGLYVEHLYDRLIERTDRRAQQAHAGRFESSPVL